MEDYHEMPKSDDEKTYDLLAPGYDLLASPERIKKEIDALEPRLREKGIRNILDAGCAVGSHSIELAKRGFKVTGIDLSSAMISEARKRAAGAGVGIRFQKRDLATAGAASGGPFDAVICLGNTIAYAHASSVRSRVLRAFAKSLRPGGQLVIQLRDLTTIRKTGHVFPTRTHKRGDEEWILLRRQDPVPKGIRFQVTVLHRASANGEWETRHTESILKVTGVTVWREAVKRAGFRDLLAAKDLAGTPRGRRGGSDLVLFASRRA